MENKTDYDIVKDFIYDTAKQGGQLCERGMGNLCGGCLQPKVKKTLIFNMKQLEDWHSRNNEDTVRSDNHVIDFYRSLSKTPNCWEKHI